MVSATLDLADVCGDDAFRGRVAPKVLPEGFGAVECLGAAAADSGAAATAFADACEASLMSTSLGCLGFWASEEVIFGDAASDPFVCRFGDLALSCEAEGCEAGVVGPRGGSPGATGLGVLAMRALLATRPSKRWAELLACGNGCVERKATRLPQNLPASMGPCRLARLTAVPRKRQPALAPELLFALWNCARQALATARRTSCPWARASTALPTDFWQMVRSFDDAFPIRLETPESATWLFLGGLPSARQNECASTGSLLTAIFSLSCEARNWHPAWICSFERLLGALSIS